MLICIISVVYICIVYLYCIAAATLYIPMATLPVYSTIDLSAAQYCYRLCILRMGKKNSKLQQETVDKLIAETYCEYRIG